MYDLPENTPYLLKENPVFIKNQFGSLDFNQLTSEIKAYKSKNNKRQPETDALLFYLASNITHVINANSNELESLSKEKVELFEKCNLLSMKISKALFFHVCSVANMMLCTYLSMDKKGSKYYDHFESTYGTGFMDYLESKRRGGSLSDIKLPPTSKLNIVTFLKGISQIYNTTQLIAWGKPYSLIVNQLVNMSVGKDSMYTGADHIWSLCHNGGTILNKGETIYNVSSDFIFDILDVQDCGQIPAWLKKNQSNQFVNAEVLSLLKDFERLYPNEIKPFNQKSLDASTTKRKAAHAAMKKQYAAWWGNIYGNANNNVNNNANANNNNNNNAPLSAKELEQQLERERALRAPKMDSLLIDSFKGMKR